MKGGNVPLRIVVARVERLLAELPVEAGELGELLYDRAAAVAHTVRRTRGLGRLERLAATVTRKQPVDTAVWESSESAGEREWVMRR